MQEGIDIRKRIREYIEIVEFLKKIDENEELDITEEYIYIAKERLERLLEQLPYGKYDTTQNKLKIWKKLHWIDAPENRITNQMRRGQKRVQRVKINIKISEELIQLGGRNYIENK